MVGIGLISYPLYLWHFPLLVFAKLVTGAEKPAFGVRVAMLALSGVLAWATYRWVEVPIRFGRHKRRSAKRLLPALAAAGALGLVVSQRVIGPRLDATETAAVETALGDFEYPSTGGFFGAGTGMIVHDIPGDSSRTVVFLGDSHAEQYFARMRAVADTSHGGLPTIRFVTYPGCSNLPHVERRGIAYHGASFRCDDFYARAMGLARAPDVVTVVLSTWWEAQLDGNRFLKGPGGGTLHEHGAATDRAYALLAHDVRKLQALGKRVFLVQSNPAGPPFNPARLLPGRVPFVEKRIHYSVERSRWIRSEPTAARIDSIGRQTGATVIDPMDWLCDEKSCPIVDVYGLPIFKDDNHLRSSYVRARATFMDQVLAR
jgi:hypothetical protein